MKLIIDIPKKTFEYYVTLANKGEQIGNLERIILDGKPLPKGHGRLIDEKEANGLIADGKNGKAYFGTVNKDWEVIDFLKTVSTIIEADKENE